MAYALQDSGSREWPAGAETTEKRKKLGQELASRVQNGLNDRKPREVTWQQGKAFYNSESRVSATDTEGSVEGFLNVVQYIVDGLGTHVLGTITSQKPYCQATLPTSDVEGMKDLGKIQRSVWFFAQRGKLGKALAQAVQPGAWSNSAHIRVEWLPDKLRPKFSAYEPDDAVVYPCVTQSLDDATFYGTRIFRRKSQIAKLQKSKFYLDGSVSAYQDPGQKKEQVYQSAQADLKHTAVKTDDALCELWYGCYEDDEGEPWWVTVSVQDSFVLRFEKVPEHYLRHDLYKFGFKNEIGSGYWDKGSVVQDVKGGQLGVNELYNMLMEGMRMNSYGVLVTEGWPGASTVESYRGGQVLSGPGMSQTQMLTSKADLSYVPQTMWQLVDHQGNVARISPAGVGGQFKAGTTATAAGLAGQGQQAGINEYISVFGEPLEGTDGIFAWIQLALYQHWEEWFPVFGALLGLEEDDYKLFDLPIEWELSASTPSATPMAQTQAVQTLIPLAGQMPGLAIDQYALGTALVENLQKMGVLGAGNFQHPEDPLQMLQQLSMKTGIPPELLLNAIKNAKLQYESIITAQGGTQGAVAGGGMVNGPSLAPPSSPGPQDQPSG